MKDLTIGVMSAIFFVLIVVLVLGSIVLLTPQIPVSVWGLTWRIVVAFACLGIVCYILNFGQRRKEVGLDKTTCLKPGTYLVICGKVDTTPSEEGVECQVNVVLSLRPEGGDEYQQVVISKKRLVQGNLANSAQALDANYPPFDLVVEPDGSIRLFQETFEDIVLHKLVFSL